MGVICKAVCVFSTFRDLAGGHHVRERALKVGLALVGLVFSAGIYPVVTSVRDGWQANNEDALPMMLSLYVTLGVFLLLAARNPSANRGVIAFAA